MTVKLGSMAKSVKRNVMDVSVAYVIRTVVYANKAVKLAFMGSTVMKRALMDARTVVTRLLRNVTFAKMDFMGINAPVCAQQAAKIDSVIRIQGNVLKDVKRQDCTEENVIKDAKTVSTMTVIRKELAAKAVHQESVL